MPEMVIPDKYTEQIPRFVLPPEVTGDKPETPPKPKTPAAPAEKPAEAKPESATETPPEQKAEETKPEETEKETTGKDPDKATTRRFERRIDRAIRAIRAKAEAEAKADLLERELAELRTKASGPAAPADPSAPKPEDFTDVEEYAKAVAAHEVKKDREAREVQSREEARTRAERDLMGNWESRSVKSSAQHDDWDEVVGDLKPTTPWAVAIMKAENGPDIAYYLGTHEQEAERIIALDPYDQIREIGKLELKLALTEKASPKPSKAPEPIAPVSAPAGPVGDEIRAGMPFEEYKRIGDKMFRGIG